MPVSPAFLVSLGNRLGAKLWPQAQARRGSGGGQASRHRRLANKGRCLLVPLLLLASCAGDKRPTTPAAAAPACRVAPNGGPLLTDRGIGGTGAPALQQADRGIGGTGIDNTGLLGIITGFASICIGGSEVAVGPATPVLLDSQPGGLADLRAGQFAAIEAVGPENALRATRVQVRHEVVGPVQAIEPGGLQVAGQRVATTPATLGSAPTPGGWVAVSGLRGPNGVIQATRLDPQSPGPSLVTGTVTQQDGQYRIGGAAIQSAARLAPGQPVVATGRWSNGTLLADAVQPDRLAAGPYGYFPANTGRVLFERLAGLSGPRLVIDRLQQDASGNITRHATVELARRADGGLQPASPPRVNGRRPGRFGEPPFQGRAPEGGPFGGGRMH